VGLMERHHI